MTNILTAAKLLESRAAFAYKLNTILEVIRDERLSDIKNWAEQEDKEHRIAFIEIYQLLKVRVLITELCVIFDPVNSSHPQYCLDSLLHQLSQNSEEIIQYHREINDVDTTVFLEINSSTLLENTSPTAIARLLKKEKRAFKRIHAVELEKIRNARNSYLVHPQTNHSLEEISVSFLKDASNWCYAFCNLILHLLSPSGARAYAPETRAQLRRFISEDYNKLADDLISST